MKVQHDAIYLEDVGKSFIIINGKLWQVDMKFESAWSCNDHAIIEANRLLDQERYKNIGNSYVKY